MGYLFVGIGIGNEKVVMKYGLRFIEVVKYVVFKWLSILCLRLFYV